MQICDSTPIAYFDHVDVEMYAHEMGPMGLSCYLMSFGFVDDRPVWRIMDGEYLGIRNCASFQEARESARKFVLRDLDVNLRVFNTMLERVAERGRRKS